MFVFLARSSGSLTNVCAARKMMESDRLIDDRGEGGIRGDWSECGDRRSVKVKAEGEVVDPARGGDAIEPDALGRISCVATGSAGMG